MTVFAGIDIGGTSVKIGYFDSDRVLLRRETLPTVVGDPETLSDQIAAAVRQMPVDRIGVGTAGAVDPEKGRVTAGNLNWREVRCARCWRRERPSGPDRQRRPGSPAGGMAERRLPGGQQCRLPDIGHRDRRRIDP
jgi:sugar (pentulose or hexulose) kinase